VCIGGEHDEVEVVFIIHGFASFTPAKVCHVLRRQWHSSFKFEGSYHLQNTCKCNQGLDQV